MRDGVDRFLAALEAENGYSNNTIFAYKNDLKQFADFVVNTCQLHSWRQLDSACLNRYSLHLREREYATSTVARKTAAVRKFCGYLVESGVLLEDPSPGMASPKVAKSMPRTLTRAEVEKLISEPLNAGHEDETIQLRDRAMLILLYGAGMRVSELVSLNVADVDLGDPSIRCHGKQERIRTVAVANDVEQALADYLAISRPAIVRSEDEEALFLNHRGQRLTRQGFWLILRRYAAEVGFDDVTPHTLRHSFATHQLMDGKDVSDVQQALGHVSVSTTQIYEQLAREMAIQEGQAGDAEPANPERALSR